DDVEWEQTKKPVTQEERMAKGQAHIANLRAMFNKK
ncbi:ATP-dependent DNA helicase Rep, partial [Vibrio vulnificus]